MAWTETSNKNATASFKKSFFPLGGVLATYLINFSIYAYIVTTV